MATTSRSKSKPSFFKVLLKDFQTELEITPQAFTEIFGSVPKEADLRTQIGSWTVSVKRTRYEAKDENSLLFYGHGWVDLVKRNGYTKGDFLVFSFKGDSHFHVFSFGKTCCLKKPLMGDPSPNPPKNHSSGSGFELVPSSHFEVTLKRFNLFGLYVPVEFVKETAMLKKKMVVVKDSEGREWPVKATEKGHGVFLGGGWSDFVRGNGLQVGMRCRIQSLTQTVVDDEDDSGGVLELLVRVVKNM